MSSKRRRRVLDEQAAWRFRRQRNANLLAVPGRQALIIVLDHLKSDYNIGKIFRSADAFAAREVHLVGIASFDPAPAMGSFKWVPTKFHSDFVGCFRELQARDYTLFALEPESGSALHEAVLPENSAFVFGHEEHGLSFAAADYPGIRTLSIPQFGRVQSLNVSVAAAVVMYEYFRQHPLG